MRVPVVGGIRRLAERRCRASRSSPACVQSLRGPLARAEESVAAHREHVLHRDGDAGVLLQFRHEVVEGSGVGALPSERRMHDDGRRSEVLGSRDGACQFGLRIAAPHPLRDEQARRMDGQHRHLVPLREVFDVGDVLTDRLTPHHQFDTVETQLGRVRERRLGVLRIDRSRRQPDRDVGHGVDHQVLTSRATPTDRWLRSAPHRARAKW